MKQAVGIVGLGLVGIALARRLLASGHPVRGYDVAAERSRLLSGIGGTAVNRVEAALACDTVVLAVFDDEQVASVAKNEIPRGTVIVDTVTGDPQFGASLSISLARRGVAYIDAPLSGSSTHIGEGGAVAMAGGDTPTFQSQRELFSTIARATTHFGPAGTGRAAKLASNLILGLNRAAFAEGLAFAEHLGLDARRFADFIADSPARSASAQSKAARMLTRDYAPESRVIQHRKDLALIETAALRSGAIVPLARLHAGLLDASIAAGDGELDNAAIVEHYRRSAPFQG